MTKLKEILETAKETENYQLVTDLVCDWYDLSTQEKETVAKEALYLLTDEQKEQMIENIKEYDPEVLEEGEEEDDE